MAILQAEMVVLNCIPQTGCQLSRVESHAESCPLNVFVFTQFILAVHGNRSDKYESYILVSFIVASAGMVRRMVAMYAPSYQHG